MARSSLCCLEGSEHLLVFEHVSFKEDLRQQCLFFIANSALKKLSNIFEYFCLNNRIFFEYFANPIDYFLTTIE